jgi:hypothetical protein
MSAKQQIKDAEYFLRLLRTKYSREEVRPLLTAFVTITKGVSDYLLEEYNLKLGLNIPLSQKLDIERFKDEVKKQNNHAALNFVNYYQSEFSTIKKDTIGSLMLGKRNIKVHRADTPLQGNFKMSLEETIHISESVTFVVNDKDGNIKKRSNNQQHKSKTSDNGSSPSTYDTMQKQPEPAKSKTEVKWFFSDYPQKEMLDICQDFLNLMSDFVSRTYKKFP